MSFRFLSVRHVGDSQRSVLPHMKRKETPSCMAHEILFMSRDPCCPFPSVRLRYRIQCVYGQVCCNFVTFTVASSIGHKGGQGGKFGGAAL